MQSQPRQESNEAGAFRDPVELAINHLRIAPFGRRQDATEQFGRSRLLRSGVEMAFDQINQVLTVWKIRFPNS